MIDVNRGSNLVRSSVTTVLLWASRIWEAQHEGYNHPSPLSCYTE